MDIYILLFFQFDGADSQESQSTFVLFVVPSLSFLFPVVRFLSQANKPIFTHHHSSTSRAPNTKPLFPSLHSLCTGFCTMADAPTSSAGGSHESGGERSPQSSIREQDRFLPIANISRIMKKALPANGKIAKDAKDTMQECVSEFISFITCEASDKCQKEKRKTINGDDLLWAMGTLGFEDYLEPLKVYLGRYREGDTKGSVRSGDGSAKRDAVGLAAQNVQVQLHNS
ncbi:hypothetical protein L6164_005574 [Bauhinia variegata]|uniref:Uncharacterized protein n=1 Tax=Bauhinia variegata TaxID=167791 RepID=A0ACB9PS48_BAUVA|nr:hypothetical protein L6164_005574 [Bauhinia variegata]